MYGESLDTFITERSWYGPLTVMIVTIFLVRVHPEPADACCKCFEDGVAFAGVFIGVKIGQWRNPTMYYTAIEGVDSTNMTIFFLKMAVKLVLGIHDSKSIAKITRGIYFICVESYNKTTSSQNIATILSFA